MDMKVKPKWMSQKVPPLGTGLSITCHTLRPSPLHPSLPTTVPLSAAHYPRISCQINAINVCLNVFYVQLSANYVKLTVICTHFMSAFADVFEAYIRLFVLHYIFITLLCVTSELCPFGNFC
jgi:hypothetical protein